MYKLKNITNKIANILKGEESITKYKYAFCTAVVIALILEVFVFNFRAVEAVFNKPVKEVKYNVINAYEVSDGEFCSQSSQVEITIDNIDEQLNNVYIGINRNKDISYTKFTLWAIDEANALGISAPAREIVSDLKQTRYVRMHFSGNVEKLKITLEMQPNEQFRIDGIRLNCHVPICFSGIRFLFTLGIIMFLYTIRPKSFIYKYALDWKQRWQRYTIIGLVVIQVMFLWTLTFLNPSFREPIWPHHDQYQKLAQSMLNGHTYLDKTVSDELMKMDNPYDTYLRQKNNVQFEWDHAYYDGKYYVYFGVVPELTFYLPYKIITGNDLNNYIVVLINCSLMSVAVLALIYTIIKKWFTKTPFGVYIILSLMIINSSGLLYIAKRPDFYSIPVVMAMMLSVTGINCWLRAETKDKAGNISLRANMLALGSISMSLVAGCRPHILIASFIGVIFFWEAVFKRRMLFSKKSIKNTVAICAPFVIIGIGIMIYNYVRFDSPFDFGANYNLTTNDMTHRGFAMDRNITGIFYYLLQPLTVTNLFPYIQTIGVQSLYQGRTVSETMCGGLLFMSPVCVLGIRGLWNRKWYKYDSRRLYAISCALIVMGVVVSVLDSQVAGILTRYCSDFSWMILIGTCIAVLAEYNFKMKNSNEQNLLKIVLVCFVISFLTYGLNIFNDIDNYAVWYKMKYLIGFML